MFGRENSLSTRKYNHWKSHTRDHSLDASLLFDSKYTILSLSFALAFAFNGKAHNLRLFTRCDFLFTTHLLTADSREGNNLLNHPDDKRHVTILNQKICPLFGYIPQQNKKRHPTNKKTYNI